MNFSEFCGGKLWDRHLTWDTDYPQFSNCFLTTIISWVPCTFLLLSSPFYYFAYLRNLPTLPSFRPSKLHIIKFLSTILMFLLQLSNFIHHATAFSNSQPQYFPSDIFTPALCLLAFSVSLLLLEVERRKRLVTSGVHFIFFLLFFISSLLYFTTFISWELMQGSRGRDTYKLVSWTFFSFLCLLQLITFSFPDRDHYDSIPPSSFSHENRPLCPEVEASFISRMFFCWIKDIVYQGYKKTLTEKDLFDLNPRDQTNKNAAALEKAWLKEVKRCERYNRKFKEQEETEDETEALLTASSSHGTFEDTHHSTIPPVSFSPDKRLKRPSLWKVIARTFGPHLFLSHVIKVFCDLLLLAGPLIQSLVIDFIEATTASSSHAWQGYFYGLLFFLNALCYTVLFQWVFHIGMNIGMRINSSLISLVYKKALTMDSEARRKTTVGEVVNLMSVDAQRIQDATAYLWMLWSSPLQIVLSLVLLWRYLGPSIFAGMAVMILMIPINAVVATYQKKLQIKQMQKKDERIKTMNELLNGIKVIKLYAWETSFLEKVTFIRGMELSTLKKFCYLAAVLTFSWSCAPFLVTLATFATFVATGGVLDAKKAFTALSLFNILRVPISILPMVVTFIIMAAVSTKRICTFLQTSELNKDNVLRTRMREAIKLENASFGWSKSRHEPNVLSRINLSIMKGSLTAVVGQVGAGKTSLVAAMLGDMEKREGRVFVDGSVGYVSQQAWIQNATLKDNILFGKPYNHEKYNQVMEVCAMKRDLEILPGGDMTEIGEKGINLSGGQKQRVSLARALYQDCDIYLLDDPLSAVDSHVAKHIFKQAIGPEGFLKDKTRVLVTHGITWLPRCDVIVVMAQGGMVSESGSYDDLLDHNVEFAKFIREFLMQHEDEEEEEEEDGGDEDAVSKRERRDRKVSLRSKKSISSAFSDDGNEADMDRDEEDDEDGSDDNDYLGLSPLPLSEALSSFEKKRQVKRLLLDRVTSILSDDDELPSFETRGSRERYERGLMISLKEKSKTRFKACSAPLERSILDYETPPLYAADDRKLLKKRKKKESVSKEEEEEGEVVAGTDRSRITMDEFAEAGQVKLSVYWTYVKSLGWLLSLIFIFAFLLFQVSALLSNFWLSKWTNDPAIVNYSLSNNNISSLPTSFYGVQLTYLAGYGGFGIMQACFILIYALVSAQGNVNSSHHLHKGLLDAILRAPMAFFDTTPIGRVLNRFSKDIEMVDNNLISTIKSWLNNFFSIISTVVVISYSTPIFLVVVFPVLLIYFFLQRFYTPTTRQLKRLESTSKSPIYNHFSESISGASVIRSFNKQEDFIARSQYLVDHNLSIYFANITSNRWLSIILDSMGGLITLSATVFAVMSRHSLSPSLVGLSISYALQITMSLTWLVRMSTQLESNIVSVERILEYSKTPSEADWYEGTENPPAGWPMRGSLLFRQYGLRYRPNLDLVLKNLNITVRGGEKIGIVGRTGAGKSSVTLALFRIIEAAEGGIFLDGVDISKLGLYKLRSSITILPQDPVLFSGSLRSNLDPTGRYTDEEVWTALEHANLKTFVNKLPMKLDHECGEGGENLSVGQRQLVCLGRTLLRKTKVLVLDEATAAVDLETDKVIQDTIRQEFKECTILIIAHRINTVLDNDRVMVMDAGSVVEFDSPSLLLANRSSHFHALAKDAGIIS